MKNIFLLIFISLLTSSCAQLENKKLDRSMANDLSANTDCGLEVKNFLNQNDYDQNLAEALSTRKFISFKQKMAIIQSPPLNWINKIKKSLINALKNKNVHQYPEFYLSNTEEIMPVIKRYTSQIEKIATNRVPIEDDETTKAFVTVSDWLKFFKAYKDDLNLLLDERITLEYNINILKTIKLKPNEVKDIQISTLKNGVMSDQIYTLRGEDSNLNYIIEKLKNEVGLLDESFSDNGKIKDRIIRQAMVFDFLTILQRELESVVKNNNASPSILEMQKELDQLNEVFKMSDFTPSSYGVYKITNKTFMAEITSSFNSNPVVKFFKTKKPLIQTKEVAKDFFNDKEAGTETEKISFFKNMYLKVTSPRGKRILLRSSGVAIVGFSIDKYFVISSPKTKEVNDPAIQEISDTNENPIPDYSGNKDMNKMAHAKDTEHLKRINQSKKTIKDKNGYHSSVIQVPNEL